MRAANVKSAKKARRKNSSAGLPSLNGLRHRSRWPDSKTKKAHHLPMESANGVFLRTTDGRLEQLPRVQPNASKTRAG